MIEIKITGEKPLEALALLVAMSHHVSSREVCAAADALIAREKAEPAAPKAMVTGIKPAQTADEPSGNASSAMPQAASGATPATPSPQAVNTPAPPTPSVTPPAPAAAPTAPTPNYTLEQLAAACTPLLDAGRREELAGLLAQFGVVALPQLPKEKYGEFATALRQLGAKI